MHVETEEIEYCKLRVKYQASPDTVKEKRKEALAQLRKLPIPGFRPGKAPDYAILARCKKQVQQWVAREMLTNAFDDTVFETKTKPMGMPEIESVDLNGDDFRCEMTFLTRPEIELKEYKEFEIPKPHLDRDVDGQVQSTLEELRTRFGDIAPYQEGDFVQEGDQVTMDVAGTIDGEEHKDATAQGELYTVGENRWPGFDDNLLGATPGEEREFDLHIADDVPNIGGKDVHFKVLVHMGTKRTPAALDDDLAQKVGLQHFGEIKEKLAVLVNDRIKQRESGLLKQQVVGRLLDNHEIKLPDWLVNSEAEQVAAQNNVKFESMKDDDKELFLKEASKNLKLSLLLAAIRDEEPDAVLSDAEALGAVKNQILAQQMDVNAFLVEAQKAGRLPSMIGMMKDEFTLQWLVEKSKVVEA